VGDAVAPERDRHSDGQLIEARLAHGAAIAQEGRVKQAWLSPDGNAGSPPSIRRGQGVAEFSGEIVGIAAGGLLVAQVEAMGFVPIDHLAA
jgi:hypothetical protein